MSKDVKATQHAETNDDFSLYSKNVKIVNVNEQSTAVCKNCTNNNAN